VSLPEVEEARTELVINHLRQQLADALARMDDNRRALADALGFDHSSLSFAALVSEAARTTVALAAAELRGAQRQREADDEEINKLKAAVAAAGRERDAYRPVVDAAKAWRNECAEYDRVASTNSVTDIVAARRRLFAAVEAFLPLAASPEETQP